jgi:hypothetical protein
MEPSMCSWHCLFASPQKQQQHRWPTDELLLAVTLHQILAEYNHFSRPA